MISEEEIQNRLNELRSEEMQLRQRLMRVQIAIEELSRILGQDVPSGSTSASMGVATPSSPPSTPSDVMLSPKSATPVLTNVGALKKAVGRH